MTFRAKTILGILAIEAVLLAVLIWTALSYLRSSTEDELVKRADTTAGLVATMTKDAVISTDLARIESFLSEVMKIPGVIYVRVHGRNGILAGAGDQKALQKTFARDTAFEDVDDGVFDIAVTITEAGHVFGRIEVGIDVLPFSKAYAAVERRVSSIALLVMALSALFSWLLGSLLARQLRGLKNASEMIAKGELGFQINVTARDEIGRVAESFNLMSDSLKRNSAERKKMEEALKENEERLRGITENISDTIIQCDCTGRITYVNRLQPGMTPDQVLSSTVFEYVPPEQVPVVTNALTAVFERGETNHYESFGPGPHGGWSTYSVSVSPIFAGREIVSAVFVARDITEGKQAEDTLRLFKVLVESSSDAIGMSTPEGRHYYQNEAFTVLFGEIGEDPPATLYVDQDVGREVFKTTMAGRRWEGEVSMYAKDRRILNIYLRAYANKDTAGRVIGLVGIHTDITGRKQAEEEKSKLQSQLMQAQKMESVGVLAGGVAHDFNNALTAIIGFAHILKNRLNDNATLARYVEHIISVSDRAAVTVRSLLAFSRKQLISPSSVDLNAIVLEMEHLLKNMIGEDIEVIIKPFGETLTVMADRGQMEQVLVNLAANARDAMPRGGRLTIETDRFYLDEASAKAHVFDRPGQYGRLIVSDTGEGMDKKTMDLIFEPFFTTKEVGKGTGLGLAMVYGIIKQHDGNIMVYSEAGRGTTFKIYLPLAENVNAVEKIAHPSEIPGGTETVLVAEDNDDVRGLLRNVLESEGYTVITAENGQDAIDKFNANRDAVRLCILDVIMPKKSGRAVMDEIKGITPDVGVLFISGYTADVLQREEILNMGYQFISKPVTPDTLLQKVRQVLENPPR